MTALTLQSTARGNTAYSVGLTEPDLPAHRSSCCNQILQLMFKTALPVLTEAVVVQRHHKGGDPPASVVAPPNSTAGLDSIRIGVDMFSRSLLFDADLVQLKAQREAAQQSCEPGEFHNITS